MLLLGVSAPQFGGGIGNGSHLMGLGSSASDACNNACFNALDGDDLTTCVNACGNNATRSACQSDCMGLSGTALDACMSACTAYPATSSGAGAGAGSQTTTSGGTPWYASLLTAVGAGAATALKPGTTNIVAPAATPWYQSPIGIGAIVIGVVGLVFLLKK